MTMPTNQAQLQRLRFIDLMARQYGILNRQTLMLMFGLSTPQASLDIASYLELAPDNLAYNNRARQYERTATFNPLFPEG